MTGFKMGWATAASSAMMVPFFHRGGDPPAEGGLVFDGFYGFSHDHTAANGPAVVVAFVQFCKNDVQIFYGFAKALSGSNFFWT